MTTFDKLISTNMSVEDTDDGAKIDDEDEFYFRVGKKQYFSNERSEALRENWIHILKPSCNVVFII